LRSGRGSAALSDARSQTIFVDSNFFEQRHQRIERRQRIQVEDHAMAELGDGRQRKKLWANLRFADR
jgi:hypothetical protein